MRYDEAMITKAIPALWRALIQRVVAEYRAALGHDLLGIALFGSVARGEAGPESDLDLYVVTRSRVSALFDPRLDGVRGIRRSREYRELVQRGYRPEPMPILHTEEELAAHPWILLDVSHHGIILYDPEGVLARELEAVRRRLAELGSKRLELPDGSWYWNLKPDWRPGDVIAL